MRGCRRTGVRSDAALDAAETSQKMVHALSSRSVLSSPARAANKIFIHRGIKMLRLAEGSTFLFTSGSTHLAHQKFMIGNQTVNVLDTNKLWESESVRVVSFHRFFRSPQPLHLQKLDAFVDAEVAQSKKTPHNDATGTYSGNMEWTVKYLIKDWSTFTMPYL